MLLAVTAAGAAELSIPRPEIHGTFRGRWEADLDDGSSRFQVRNARVSLSGSIIPEISYFFQTDLCDRGKMKILDAYGQIAIAKGLNIRVGQFRMPTGSDPFRMPHTYFFSNRSVIGKEMCNYRAVGARAAWTLPHIPLTFEGGAFNPTSMADHNVWVKTLAFGTKATYTIKNITLIAGFESLEPDSVRFNIADATVRWTSAGWTVEGEYMNKHYSHKRFSTCHGWNLFANYAMGVKAGFFNQLSFQGRFDGMTAHSTGTRDDSGYLITDDPARRRITVGSTISYVAAAVRCDIRLDYEKYFLNHGTRRTPSLSDRLTLEMVIRF